MKLPKGINLRQLLTLAEFKQNDTTTGTLLRNMSLFILDQLHPDLRFRPTINEWMDRPVSEMDVSTRAHHAIKQSGYNTIRQVYEFGWNAMRRTTGFGNTTKREIDQFFLSQGLIWPEYPTPFNPPETAPARATDISVMVPLPLFDDMRKAVEEALANHLREYGRFADRGAQKSQYDRLNMLISRIQDETVEVVTNGSKNA